MWFLGCSRYLQLIDEKREERAAANLKGQMWTCCDVGEKVVCTLAGCHCYEALHHVHLLYVSRV